MTRRAPPRSGLPLAGLITTGALLTGCATLDRTWNQVTGAEEPTETEQEIPRELTGPLPEDPLEHPVFHPRPYVDWTRHATHLEIPDEDEPTDLWERIRQGFAMEAEDNRRVQQRIDWYQRHPAYLDRVANRAEPYLYHILEEIEERDLPTELALLPVVESAYDPFAYSHGQAAGIWQFIPSTGRHFGLDQNWWYDGRRDIQASTEAALQYLENLAERFDGDWELALASYNAGAGNIRRAIRQNERRGQDSDYWSLDNIPRETQGYVPKLIALRQVVKDPEEYDLTLRPLDNEPYLAQVELDAQIDLAVAADLANLDLDELYHYNPAFNRWATPPEGPHRLLIPLDHKEPFEKGLSELDTSEQVQWRRHRVRSGESLGQIAQRHNVTVSFLQEINNLDGYHIRAGGHLLVPEATDDLTDYSGSLEQRLANIRATQRGDRERIEHTVQAGESFWTISRQYGVDTRQLAQWNGMAPGDTLRSGQELVVWVDDASDAGLASRMNRGPSNPERTVNYQVRPGDSLYAIANRFGVSVSDIKRWNNLSAEQPLQPGQEVEVTVDVTNLSGG